MKPTGADPSWTTVDAFVEAFEQAQAGPAPAPLDPFLPPRDHPLYLPVLCELVRVDLEYGWQRGTAPRLDDYLRRFPELAGDKAILEEIAFEEYRQRRQTGEAPAAEEYARRFGIDTAAWPGHPEAEAAAGLQQAALAYRQSRAQPGNWSRSFAAACAAAAERTRVLGSAAAGRLPLDLFRDLHEIDPEMADRLAEGLTELPEVGGQFLNFRLLEELGRGAFGRVFLAQQGELADRPVALKIAADIADESRTLAQLQHTHIVPLYSIHRAGALQAVCMPYFGRTTLADVLRDLARRPALPQSGRDLLTTLRRSQTREQLQSADRKLPSGKPTPDAPSSQSAIGNLQSAISASVPFQKLHGYSYVEAVLWLGCCLADGLAHAHERGIVHRDLKPANILLTDEGQPMLLDFNLSEDTKLRGSLSGAFIGGTLPYMAPEHLEAFTGKGGAPDARSDIFALGIILYELLTCRTPFALPAGALPPARATEEADQAELDELPQRMIADRRRPPPPARIWNRAVSPAAAAILRRCLEPDPARRYQTARALQEDLQRHLEHKPLQHAAEPLRERAGKWLRRNPRLLGRLAAAVAVLVLVVALALGYRAYSLARSEEALTRAQTAADSLAHLREEMQTIKFLVNTWSIEVDERDKGLTLCRQALDHYGVLDDPAWRERPLVAALPDGERQRLPEYLGELLLLLARGRAGLWRHAGGPAPAAEVQAALELNQRAETCYPEKAAPRALWLQRAQLLRLLGQESAARELETEAEGRPLRTAQDYYLTARELTGAHRHGDALPLLREALRRDPQDYWAWFLLGECHEQFGQDEPAIGCYGSCVALAPGSYVAYFNRGMAYLRRRQDDLAGADFDRVLELRPGHAGALLARAAALQGQKKDREALADLTAVLEQGGPTRIYFLRARVRDRLGDRDGAARDWAEGMRREPADEESWGARGWARLGNDPAGALADFDRGLALNPRSLGLLENKAHVLAERLGRTEEGIATLTQLLALYPDNARARRSRGVLHARLGHWDAALQDARDALDRDASPPSRYQVAGIYALCSTQDRRHVETALQLLGDALRGGYGADWLGKDSDLNPIREQPGFKRLLEAAAVLAPGP
jgi:serine/threonine protein kinase/Tfp pilus assembly protein PilF